MSHIRPFWGNKSIHTDFLIVRGLSFLTMKGSSANRVGDFGRFSIGQYARCQGGGSREGPRGRIPPMAGHNEALGLSSVRVGK